MKIVFVRDKKTGKTDIFKYYESGPLPPIINPPDPGSPKDEAPALAEREKEEDQLKG
jgi:hypothetical protein